MCLVKIRTNESSDFNALGGEGEIRTLAPVSRSTPLAGEPLTTWVQLQLQYNNIKLYNCQQYDILIKHHYG